MCADSASCCDLCLACLQRTMVCTTCSKAVHAGLLARTATPSLAPTAGIMLARASLHALPAMVSRMGGSSRGLAAHNMSGGCCSTDLVHWDDRGIGPSSQDESWHGFTSKRPTPPCSGFVTVDDVSFLSVGMSKLVQVDSSLSSVAAAGRRVLLAPVSGRAALPLV